jgi:hypothetical protein
VIPEDAPRLFRAASEYGNTCRIRERQRLHDGNGCAMIVRRLAREAEQSRRAKRDTGMRRAIRSTAAA